VVRKEEKLYTKIDGHTVETQLVGDRYETYLDGEIVGFNADVVSALEAQDRTSAYLQAIAEAEEDLLFLDEVDAVFDAIILR
jgi:hypothetical protein